VKIKPRPAQCHDEKSEIRPGWHIFYITRTRTRRVHPPAVGRRLLNHARPIYRQTKPTRAPCFLLGLFRAGDWIQVPTKIRRRRGFPTQKPINNRNHHDLANVMPTSENADLPENRRIPAGEGKIAWRFFSSTRKKNPPWKSADSPFRMLRATPSGRTDG
jgi:hypothetical protein